MKYTKISIFIFLICIFNLQAESVYLKNGTVHKGKITAMDENSIKMKTTEGKQLTISKSKVLKVFYKDISKKEMQEIIKKEESKKPVKKIDQLKELKEEREKLLADLQKKDANIDSLKREIAEKEKYILELETDFSRLENDSFEKTEKLENTQDELYWKDQELEIVQNELVVAKEELNEKENPLPVKKEIPLKKEISDSQGFDKWGVVGRSAVLPGWGHLHLGQKKIGYTYMGLFWVTFAYTFTKYQDLNKTKKDFENVPFIPTPEGNLYGLYASNQKFAEFQKAESSFKQGFTLLSLFYIGQLTHAYFSGKEAEKKSGFSFQIYQENPNYFVRTISSTWELRYTIQF